MELIDRSKCGSEYSLCDRCKHQGEDRCSAACEHCTQVVDIGYQFIICGVPVGSGISWYHKNFDEKGGVKK